jgi:hypothetical protein
MVNLQGQESDGVAAEGARHAEGGGEVQRRELERPTDAREEAGSTRGNGDL